MLIRKSVARVFRGLGVGTPAGEPPGSHPPRARLAIVVCIVLAAALLLAACGGGGDSTSSAPATTESSSPPAETESEPAAEEPTGSPLKTFTVATINAQNVPTFANIGATAEVYEQWINSHGGIAGHPLEVTVCDDRGEPTEATACAREAVENGAVAGVGSFTFLGEGIIPVLEKGETAWFGNCCGQIAPEFSSKISFLIGSQPAYAAGLVAKAYEEGCTNLNAIFIEGYGATFEPVLNNAAKAYGKKIGKFVEISGELKDYSAPVTEALGDDADCVIAIIGETQFPAFWPAWQQSGTEAKVYGVQGNLNENAVKGFEEVAEGSVVGGMFTDISTAPWSEMREALDQYATDKSLDYNSLGALGDWAGYTAFANVVEGMKGEINNKTFLKAASETTALETGGMVPVINFQKEWTDGLEGFPRLFSRSVAFSKIEGGKVVPLSDELYDASDLMTGTGKLAEGVAP